MRPRLSLVAALALLAACAAQPSQAPSPAAPPMAAAAPAPAVPADDNLNAVTWTQSAIEHDLIYLQTYRDAQQQLLAALADPHWDALSKADRVVPAEGLEPAVVLDVDETVLDNSPYQARLIRSGGEFNEPDWATWCKEARARALPGVVEFARFAVAHGVAVFYLSNRSADLDQATLANLRDAGLPVSGPQSFLGLGTFIEGCEEAGSEKGCRRQLVARHHRVLMQFGDQLGDFLDVLPNTPDGRARAAAPYLGWIGKRWFVLPNTTYGSWEPALFDNDWTLPREERRRRKIAALHTD